MKRLLIILFVCSLAAPVMAFLGLPFGDDANTYWGEKRITGSITLESDVNLYGGRFTYGLTEEMAVFGGVGIIDIDHWDSEPYFQFGGQYSLPVDTPFDIALRGAFGITSFDEVDLWTLNLGALLSYQIDPMFTVYGFGGISHHDWEVSYRAGMHRVSYSDSDTELAIAGGAIFTLDDNISFFGELAHIDDLFISLGARFNF